MSTMSKNKIIDCFFITTPDEINIKVLLFDNRDTRRNLRQNVKTTERKYMKKKDYCQERNPCAGEGTGAKYYLPKE